MHSPGLGSVFISGLPGVRLNGPLHLPQGDVGVPQGAQPDTFILAVADLAADARAQMPESVPRAGRILFTEQCSETEHWMESGPNGVRFSVLV